MKLVLTGVDVSERRKTFNVLITERNALPMYTTVGPLHCQPSPAVAHLSLHPSCCQGFGRLCVNITLPSLCGSQLQTCVCVLCEAASQSPLRGSQTSTGRAQPPEDKISRCLGFFFFFFLPTTPRDGIPTGGITEHVWKELAVNELDQVKTRGP